MKHFWMGLGLLLALVGASIGVRLTVERIHTPIRRELEAAADAVLAADWDRAEATLSKADEAWRESRRLAAAITGHAAIEDMDSLFAQAALYAALRDQCRCAAACRELAALSEAAAEAQKLTWWNLL